MATSKFDPTKRSSIDSVNQNNPGNNATTIGVVYAGGSKSQNLRAIIEYNIYGAAASGNPIAPDDTITAAQLEWNITSLSAFTGRAAHIFRLTRNNWVSAEATWLVYKSGSNWTTSGGDFDTGLSVAFTTASSAGLQIITGLLNFVTDAIANRGGLVELLMKMDDESDDGQADRVSGSPIQLAITYTPANRRAQLTWAELEIPTAPRQAQLTWVELEVPNAPRQAQLTWAELEIPTAPRQAQLTWAELEVSNAPRQAQLTWAELEVSDAPRRAQLTWTEFEVPNAPRQAQLTWAEAEVPNAPSRAQLTWVEFEVDSPPTAAPSGTWRLWIGFG